MLIKSSVLSNSLSLTTKFSETFIYLFQSHHFFLQSTPIFSISSHSISLYPSMSSYFLWWISTLSFLYIYFFIFYYIISIYSFIFTCVFFSSFFRICVPVYVFSLFLILIYFLTLQDSFNSLTSASIWHFKIFSSLHSMASFFKLQLPPVSSCISWFSRLLQLLSISSSSPFFCIFYILLFIHFNLSMFSFTCC